MASRVAAFKGDIQEWPQPGSPAEGEAPDWRFDDPTWRGMKRSGPRGVPSRDSPQSETHSYDLWNGFDARIAFRNPEKRGVRFPDRDIEHAPRTFQPVLHRTFQEAELELD